MGVFTLDNLWFMIKAAGISLFIGTSALILGILIGVLMASFRISKNKFLNIIGRIYVDLIRGTPMLLHIFYLYLGIPSLFLMLTGKPLRLDAHLIAIIAIAINSGAYGCELIRSGINSIDKGQWEAAKTLGLTHRQTMLHIILPQAFRNLIPPFVSEYITLIKDTSLVSTIGIVELLQSAKVIGTTTFDYITPLTIAAVIYLIMTQVIAQFSYYLERRLQADD